MIAAIRPGELLADTHSGSSTERQEGAAWLAGRLQIEAVRLPVLTAQPALRPELLRLSPPTVVAMQQCWTDQAHDAGWHRLYRLVSAAPWFGG
jgi:hypothetical protein